MTNNKSIQGAVFIFLSILCIAGCYMWFDKPIAFWVYHHNLSQFAVFNWITYTVNLIVIFSFLFYLWFFIRLLIDNRYRNRWLFFANSVVVTIFLKEQFKFIFGRYWPNTWVDNNLSLIRDNVYGFNFFHGGQAYASFPSGHAAITVAAMLSIYLLYPRLKLPAMLVGLMVMISLVAMNFHFLSDVLAGALVGTVTTFAISKVYSDRLN